MRTAHLLVLFIFFLGFIVIKCERPKRPQLQISAAASLAFHGLVVPTGKKKIKAMPIGDHHVAMEMRSLVFLNVTIQVFEKGVSTPRRSFEVQLDSSLQWQDFKKKDFLQELGDCFKVMVSDQHFTPTPTTTLQDMGITENGKTMKITTSQKREVTVKNIPKKQYVHCTPCGAETLARLTNVCGVMMTTDPTKFLHVVGASYSDVEPTEIIENVKPEGHLTLLVVEQGMPNEKATTAETIFDSDRIVRVAMAGQGRIIDEQTAANNYQLLGDLERCKQRLRDIQAGIESDLGAARDQTLRAAEREENKLKEKLALYDLLRAHDMPGLKKKIDEMEGDQDRPNPSKMSLSDPFFKYAKATYAKATLINQYSRNVAIQCPMEKFLPGGAWIFTQVELVQTEHIGHRWKHNLYYIYQNEAPFYIEKTLIDEGRFKVLTDLNHKWIFSLKGGEADIRLEAQFTPAAGMNQDGERTVKIESATKKTYLPAYLLNQVDNDESKYDAFACVAKASGDEQRLFLGIWEPQKLANQISTAAKAITKQLWQYYNTRVWNSCTQGEKYACWSVLRSVVSFYSTILENAKNGYRSTDNESKITLRVIEQAQEQLQTLSLQPDWIKSSSWLSHLSDLSIDALNSLPEASRRVVEAHLEKLKAHENGVLHTLFLPADQAQDLLDKMQDLGTSITSALNIQQLENFGAEYTTAGERLNDFVRKMNELLKANFKFE